MRRSLLAVFAAGAVAVAAFVACVGDDAPTPATTPDSDAATTGDGPASSGDGSGGGQDSGGDSASSGCTTSQTACNGGCVETTSFQTDAKSCGACGHDCLGATCTGGKCAAIPIFPATVTDAATVEPVRNIVVDATTVYFTASQAANGSGSPGFYSCPIAGCASPTLLLAGNTWGLAMTPTAPTRILFSIPQDDVVLRYSPAGSGGDRFTSCAGNELLCRFSGFPQSDAIATDGTTVYWGTGVPGPGGFNGNNGYKVALPNGGAAIDLGSAAAGTAISMVSAALDSDDATKKYLYVADSTGDGGRILAFTTSGTPAPVVLAGSGSTTGVSSVIVKNGLVYWASKTGIYSAPVCPAASCPATPPTPVKVYAIANATAVVADATKLYFAAGATVSSCTFASCATPKPLFEGATANVLSLAQDATAIYLGDDHGNVARVAK